MLLFGRGFFFFFCFLAPLDSTSDPLGICLTKKWFVFFLRFSHEYCRRWFSQLIAPRCWRLACSQLETQYVIRDALCSENLFVNRIVHDPRRSWTEVWLYFVDWQGEAAIILRKTALGSIQNLYDHGTQSSYRSFHLQITCPSVSII